MNNNDIIDEMLPCPFCGCKKTYVEYKAQNRYPYKFFAFAKCSMCGAQTKTFSYFGSDTDREFNWEDGCVYAAVNAWNTRAGR